MMMNVPVWPTHCGACFALWMYLEKNGSGPAEYAVAIGKELYEDVQREQPTTTQVVIKKGMP